MAAATPSPSQAMLGSSQPIPPLGATAEEGDVGAAPGAPAEIPLVPHSAAEAASLQTLPHSRQVWEKQESGDAAAGVAEKANGHANGNGNGPGVTELPASVMGEPQLYQAGAVEAAATRSGSVAWASDVGAEGAEEESRKGGNRVRTFDPELQSPRKPEEVAQGQPSELQSHEPEKSTARCNEFGLPETADGAIQPPRVNSFGSLGSIPESHACDGGVIYDVASGRGRRMQIDVQSTHMSVVEESESIQNCMCAVYLEQYLRRTTLDCGDLDQWWTHLGKATASAHFAQVFNVSFPITSALSKKWFLAFSLIFGFSTLLLSVRYATSANLLGVVHASFLRFTVLQLRGGPDVVATRPVVGSVGLLRAGCKEPLDHVLMTPTWTELEVELPGESGFDGFFFETVADDPAEDPVLFELEFRNSEDEEWMLLASSKKVLERGGTLRWERESASVPEERGADVRVSFHVPWYAYMRETLSRAGIAVCALSLTWFSLRKRYHLGRPTIQISIVFLGACHLVDAVGRNIEGHFFGALPLQYLSGLGAMVFAYSLRIRESYFMESISAYTLWCIVLAAIEDLALDPAPARLRDQAAFLVTGVMGILLVLVRTRSRHDALKTIQEDMRMYAEVWQGIMSDRNEKEAMDKINTILSSVDLPSGHVMQEMQVKLPRGFKPLFAPPEERERRGSKAAERRGSRRGSMVSVSRRDSRVSNTSSFPPRSPAGRTLAVRPWSPSSPVTPTSPQARGPAPSFAVRVSSSASTDSEGWSVRWNRGRNVMRVSFLTQLAISNKSKSGTRPVTSLSLLYTQAVGLHPLTTVKVKQWAKASRGRIPLLDSDATAEGDTFVLWEDMEGDEEKEAQVRWPGLKKPERAIEKLVRTYGGKVGLLQDLVRYSLVFDKASELVTCLEAVVADKDVRIVDLKNRLRQDYDPWKTAGYRDVHLNLVLRTPLAEKLGVDTHVFELQLQLVPFAKRKSAGGHKRYVTFRNALCL